MLEDEEEEEEERKRDSVGEANQAFVELVKRRRVWCLLFASTARERREGRPPWVLRMREVMLWAAIELVAMMCGRGSPEAL